MTFVEICSKEAVAMSSEEAVAMSSKFITRSSKTIESIQSTGRSREECIDMHHQKLLL